MNKLIKLSFALTLSFSTLVYDYPCPSPCLKNSFCHKGQCIDLTKSRLVAKNCHTINYCSSQQSCVLGVCISTDRTIKCDKCQTGQNCIYGKCVASPINENQNITDCMPRCNSDDQCSNGQCVSKVQRCRGNGDCRFNQVCRQRKCVEQEQNKPCKITCLKGYQCKYGNCVLITDVGGCGFDSDCGLNQVCLDRICVDKDDNGCRQVCPSGYVCLKGQCVQSFQYNKNCYDITQCQSQEACVQGECVLKELDKFGGIKD